MRSRNSAIQSFIVQSDSIDFDYPLPLLFSVLFIENAWTSRLRGPWSVHKDLP